MKWENTFYYAGKKAEGNPNSRLLRLPRGVGRLEELGETVSYPKNHVLVKQGGKTNFCYIVKKGRVMGHEYTAGGDEMVYDFNEQNSVLLEAFALFDWECPVEFKTVVPSELVKIPREALMKAVMSDPEVSMDIIQAVSMKFVSAMEQIRQIYFHSAEWRICDLFLVFAEQYGAPYDGKVLLQEKISQQMVASLLGINRVTATRAIKGLKDMGLIEQINGYYCIRDVEKLERHRERLLK